MCSLYRTNIIILNWQRPLWEGDQEVAKRSDRNEPVWVVIIHMCMETMLGISLYSYFYLKLAKMLCFSYYLLYFLSNKVGELEGRTGSAQKWRGVAQIMYTQVSKYKNHTIKKPESRKS
jgi:hypothetical protein